MMMKCGNIETLRLDASKWIHDRCLRRKKQRVLRLHIEKKKMGDKTLIADVVSSVYKMR